MKFLKSGFNFFFYRQDTKKHAREKNQLRIPSFLTRNKQKLLIMTDIPQITTLLNDTICEKTELLQDTFVYGSRARNSHAKDTVSCSARVSAKCKIQVTTRYESIVDVCNNHEGQYICLYCARTSQIKKHKNDAMKLQSEIEHFETGKYAKNSHHIVKAFCSLRIAEKCTGEQVSEYRVIQQICETSPNGQYICIFCSRQVKYMGNGNPNCRYKLDHNLFKVVDTEFKAYLLGWIASDGHIAKNGEINISIHEKDVVLLTQLKDGVCKELPIQHCDHNLVKLSICSTTMNFDVAKWLGLEFKKGESHKKSHLVRFPNLETDALKWHFLRGYFDGDGCLTVVKPYLCPRTSIGSNSFKMLESIKTFVNLGCSLGATQIEWSATSSLLFMQRLYFNSTIRLHRKYDLWLTVKDWRPFHANPRKAIEKRLEEQSATCNKRLKSDSAIQTK